MLPTNILFYAAFAAIIAILAQISIPCPFSPVPITGQTFGVFLAGAILGGVGCVSMLTYIFIGAIGFLFSLLLKAGCICCWGQAVAISGDLSQEATCWANSSRDGGPIFQWSPE